MKITFKIIYFTLFMVVVCSCTTKYEQEELTAIEDISNDYLYENDLSKILNPPDLGDNVEIEKVNINNLYLRVYVSDELRPIQKIKEDNLWMFKNNKMSPKDSITFFRLMNSEKFKSLAYRTFDKSKVKFIQPYHYFDYNKQELKEGQNFNSISFSRFCFNDDFTYGITVIDYNVGANGYNFMGYNMALLIKKIDGKWKIIEPK